MKKEITMTIPQFMEIQRGELTIDQLYSSELSELLYKNQGSFETAGKVILFASVVVSVYSLLRPSETVQVFGYNNSDEAQKELLKEGFELLYKLTTETIKYGYKLFTAIM
jgi:hypothetical protein